jgi:hypothetical protein
MKHLVFLLLVLLLAACGSQAPVIEVEPMNDFGTVKKGEVATMDVVVRNAGRSPLVIENIITTCGCTSGTLSETTIQPDGEAILSVRYDSAAHETDMGQLERRLYLMSNGADENGTLVRFKVLVEP